MRPSAVALETAPTASTSQRQTLLSRISKYCVYVFEKAVPDPFVFAVILTFLSAAMAYALTATRSPLVIAVGWYNGVFNILTFGFQMVLMLVTGSALANSPAVHRMLLKIASVAKTPRDAVSLTILIGMVASWTNWGFGLIISALLARELAKRVRMDFGWLVAAAYTGFVVSTEGLSGSIALSQATPGSILNIAEKTVGHGLPLRETVFAAFNLIPIAALLILLPVIFRFTEPAEENSVIADPDRLRLEDEPKRPAESGRSLGRWLDHAWILNVLLIAGGVFGLIGHWKQVGFSIDLNSVILIFLLLGLLFHWRPLQYVEAIKKAARVTGPLILQYPLYGGIMGIMTATGLAVVISKAFISFSTARTLPFWTYLSSIFITWFIPSGGGHWAVQGPFVLPAARDLHASLAGTTMAVAMGESVGNMLQPFFALPILAIAGIGMRRMMGYMVVTFVVAFMIFGASLLLLVPR